MSVNKQNLTEETNLERIVCVQGMIYASINTSNARTKWLMRSVRLLGLHYIRWPNFCNVFLYGVQDLEGYKALLVYLDLVVPQAPLDQMVEEEEKEPLVPLDHKENEAAKDYQDLLDP